MKKWAVSTSWITARTRGRVRRVCVRRRRFVLQKAVRNGGQDDMPLPPGEGPSLEVIEADLVLEFLVLLFDGPALMGQGDQRPERRRGGQIHQVIAERGRHAPIPVRRAARLPERGVGRATRARASRGRHRSGPARPAACRCARRRAATGAALARPPRRALRSSTSRGAGGGASAGGLCPSAVAAG